jgi:hypothetical protein
MVIALLLGIISAGAWWTAARAPGPWPIVVQQSDGNLALVDGNGKLRPLTNDANGSTLMYRFPTPAPDGRSIATVALRHTATSISSRLMIHRLDAEPITLYEQPDSHPFYLSWSPDSSKIAFLANDQDGMALHGVEIDGQQPTLIAPGEPSYFAWSPDSRQLFLHIGGAAPTGSLQIYDWGTAKPRPLASMPALFQAPAWLPDGKQTLAVVRQPTGATLATLDAQGRIAQQLATVNDGTVFVATSDASHIAYITYTEDTLGELHILRAADANDRLVRSGVATCFWSPAGDTLAFLTVADQGEAQTVAFQETGLRLRWNVVDLQNGAIRSFELFQPSQEFLDLLPFFDQYAQSIRLWDRTGSRLLYADTDGVYTLDVRSGQSQRVSDGVLGLWADATRER